MENLKYKNRDLFRIRSVANAFIVLLLGGLLSNCNEAENALNGNKAAGAIDDPPALTCEAGGVAVEFKTGTKGYIQGDAAQCVLPGAKTTEVTANHYSGFVFERWTNGEEQRLEETLVIENPSEAQTWTAEFSTSGLNTVWLAYSFVKQSQVYLKDIVEKTETSEGLGFNDHTDEIFANSGCKGSPGYMRYEAETLASDKAGYDAALYLDDAANAGKVDNLFLTYYPYVGSTFEDYKYWIDKLNVHNPNARVFIVTPWSRGPEAGHTLHEDDDGCENKVNSQPNVWPADAKDANGDHINVEKYKSHRYVYEDESRAVDIENDIYYSEDESILSSLPTFKKNVLNRLEEEFDNKIIIVPQIALASRILQAQYQNTLSYGDDPSSQATLDVTGHLSTSIFNDATGHGSRILRVSAAMLYASYLYDEDIDTDAYRSDVWDSKDVYINSGGADFNKPLSYFQGLDLVDLVSDIYNGKETTEYQCDGHRVTLRAGANGSIEGKSRRCITDGEGISIEAIADELYSFTNWSDGVTDNPRTLTAGDINEDITLTANFLEAEEEPEPGPVVTSVPTFTVNGMDPNAAGCVCVDADPDNDIVAEHCWERYPQAASYTYGTGVSFAADGTNKGQKHLLLDIYSPDNTSENRPAFMFIHGGSFMSGSRTKCDIRKMAYYFSSRGWVFISIDYRTGDGDLFRAGQSTLDHLTSTDLDQIVPVAWKDWTIANTEDDDPYTKETLAKAGISMYTAQRDAKAAMRWLVASAADHNINPDYITVGGNSAGAITAVTLGISNQEDFRDELRSGNAYGNPVDLTLATTKPNRTYSVRSIVNFWGGTIKLDNYKEIYGHDRYDSNDPELFTAHGTNDQNPFTPPDGTQDLHEKYEELGIYNERISLSGHGHDAWHATVDGKSLSELAFDFLVDRQNLEVE